MYKKIILSLASIFIIFNCYSANVTHKNLTGTDLHVSKPAGANGTVQYNSSGNMTGATNLTIDDAGNVGVGTTAPTSRLTVSANAATLPAPDVATLLHLGQADGSANVHVLLDAFGTNSPAITFRRSNGTGASPSAILADSLIISLRGVGYRATSYSNSKVAVRGVAAENWTDTAQGTYITLLTTPKLGTDLAERVRIDDAGNVGIGTTEPFAKLVIGNGSGINRAAIFAGAASYSILDFADATSGTGMTVGGIGYEHSSNSEYFVTDNVERMRIISNGNVGIGTTTPNATLEVIGNVSVSGNITGTFILGNGSQLTGLAGGGNANYAFAGNNFNGTGNFTTTGNVTGGFIIGNGSQLAGIPNNATVDAKGNANYSFGANNFIGTGSFNGSIGNFTTEVRTPLLTVTGNASAGNYSTAGIVTATGNVTGNFFIGNGSQLAGLPAYLNESTAVGDTTTVDMTLTGSTVTGAVIANTTQQLVEVYNGSTQLGLNKLIRIIQGQNMTIVGANSTNGLNLTFNAIDTTGGAGTYVNFTLNETAPINFPYDFNATNLKVNNTAVILTGGSALTLTSIPVANATGVLPVTSYIVAGHMTGVNGSNTTDLPKGFVIYNLTAVNDVAFWEMNNAATVTSITAVSNGLSAANFTIEEWNSTGTGYLSIILNSTGVASNTKVTSTSFNDSAVAAGNYLYFNCTGAGGNSTLTVKIK